MKTPRLSDLIEISRAAGDLLRSGFDQKQEVSYKGPLDLVTEMDRRSEALIIERIRALFPEHSLLAEESGADAGSDEHIWYIDPLDGTVNYAHNIPIFTVSLAYAYRGTVKLGVVYAPMLDEFFSAELGKGAWFNGAPIRVSQVDDLLRSLLVTGFAYEFHDRHANLEYYRRFSLCSQGVRRLGSAALDLCYVAAGRFEGYWETSIQPWDIAAGVLIAQEAGAQVTRLMGEALTLTPPCTVLAAPPPIHTLMLDVLKSDSTGCSNEGSDETSSHRAEAS